MQSKYIFSLLAIDRDISELFRQLSDYEYAVIRGNKQHTKFPHSFYFLTDIDILVKPEAFTQVHQLVYEYASQHFTSDWISVRSEESGTVYVEMRDIRIFKIDILMKTSGCSRVFLDECLSNRLRGKVNVLRDEYEVVIRMGEYIKHPWKEHHLTYIRERRNLINRELVKAAYGTMYNRKFIRLFQLEGIL